MKKQLSNKNSVCVLGLGYVGLTLSLVMAKANINVFGYDKNKKTLKQIQKLKPHVYEKGIKKILKQTLNKKFHISNQIPDFCKTYIVTVGTPVKKNGNEINLKQIIEITKSLATVINNNPLIIFRSTLPIGTCKKKIIPLLKKYNLNIGVDYNLAFAPERTIEGDAINELNELPQIISGYDKKSLIEAVNFYKKFTKTVVKVKSLEAAELIKLINNSYRDLSFAFANQIGIICDKLNISANQIIKLSNYKYPRSRIPLPSPGVGGPCLTKDPFILNKFLKKKNSIFVEGRKVNNQIIIKLIDKINLKLNDKKFPKILLMGLSFKGFPETKDFRQSSSVIFYKNLKKNKKNKVYIFDPLFRNDANVLKNFNFFDILTRKAKFDAIIILNNNKFFSKMNKKKIQSLLKTDSFIYDYWSMWKTKKFKNKKNKYFEIGE